MLQKSSSSVPNRNSASTTSPNVTKATKPSVSEQPPEIPAEPSKAAKTFAGWCDSLMLRVYYCESHVI